MNQPTTPRVPTRAEHAREAQAQLEAAGLWGGLSHAAQDGIVGVLVDARAHERRQARAEAARDVCRQIGERLGVPESLVATLALLGQGGPMDGGGPMAASQLPLLPIERRWQWRRAIGPAWLDALRSVAGAIRLRSIRLPRAENEEVEVDLEIHTTYPQQTLRLQFRPSAVSDPEFARALARAVMPGAQDVEGRDIVSESAYLFAAVALPENIHDAAKMYVARVFRRHAEELECRERLAAAAEEAKRAKASTEASVVGASGLLEALSPVSIGHS